MDTPYALQCREYGTPPLIAAEPLPPDAAPAPGEVLIAVDRAAFNFTDHLMIQGRYQDKPVPPFVPGLDAAGTVLAVGAGVQGFRPGDEVVSSGVVGAWSARLRAPAHRLVKLPGRVTPADAVASINSHLTAYHGLVDRAALRAGERVLVLGANGAVGQAAAQIARHLGAEVFTVARDGGLLRLAGPQGAELRVAPAELKHGLRELLGAQGADVVVDPVGDCYTEAALRNLGWRGRLLVIGFAAGDIPKIPTNLLLLKGATVMGVYCGGLLLRETAAFTAQLAAMLALIDAGVLTPSPHETLPAHRFDAIWTRFAEAPRGTKVLLGFGG